MSRNYDNWERLVAAVLKKQMFRELALAPSRQTSFSSSVADRFNIPFSFKFGSPLNDGLGMSYFNAVILLADHTVRVLKDTAIFKQECSDIKSKAEKVAVLLRRAARENHDLYDRPVHCVMDTTKKVLKKAISLVLKCGGLRRVFSSITAASLHNISLELEHCIGNICWLLRDDQYQGIPPIAADEPVLYNIWELIAILHTGPVDGRCNAAASLLSLVSESDAYRKSIIDEGVIEPLLRLVHEGTREGQEDVVTTIQVTAIILIGKENPQALDEIVSSVFMKILEGSSQGTDNIGDGESKLEDAQVDEDESTSKEAMNLTYKEARALLGRLDYQRGNFDSALRVFQGIDVKALSPRMSKAIADRILPPLRKMRSQGRGIQAGVMLLHTVSLLLEAILLKAKCLEELGRIKEAARECKIILDTVESALPNGLMHCEISGDNKWLEVFHRALELFPKLWVQAGSLDEAIAAYRRALLKPWNINPERLAKLQKDLAATLLHGGFIPSQFPESSSAEEESILLLFILMQKALSGEVEWNPEVMDHFTYALTIFGEVEPLADLVEQLLHQMKTATHTESGP